MPVRLRTCTALLYLLILERSTAKVDDYDSQDFIAEEDKGRVEEGRGGRVGALWGPKEGLSWTYEVDEGERVPEDWEVTGEEGSGAVAARKRRSRPHPSSLFSSTLVNNDFKVSSSRKKEEARDYPDDDYYDYQNEKAAGRYTTSRGRELPAEEGSGAEGHGDLSGELDTDTSPERRSGEWCECGRGSVREGRGGGSSLSSRPEDDPPWERRRSRPDYLLPQEDTSTGETFSNEDFNMLNILKDLLLSLNNSGFAAGYRSDLTGSERASFPFEERYKSATSDTENDILNCIRESACMKGFFDRNFTSRNRNPSARSQYQSRFGLYDRKQNQNAFHGRNLSKEEWHGQNRLRSAASSRNLSITSNPARAPGRGRSQSQNPLRTQTPNHNPLSSQNKNRNAESNDTHGQILTGNAVQGHGQNQDPVHNPNQQWVVQRQNQKKNTSEIQHSGRQSKFDKFNRRPTNNDIQNQEGADSHSEKNKSVLDLLNTENVFDPNLRKESRPEKNKYRTDSTEIPHKTRYQSGPSNESVGDRPDKMKALQTLDPIHVCRNQSEESNRNETGYRGQGESAARNEGPSEEKAGYGSATNQSQELELVSDFNYTTETQNPAGSKKKTYDKLMQKLNDNKLPALSDKCVMDVLMEMESLLNNTEKRKLQRFLVEILKEKDKKTIGLPERPGIKREEEEGEDVGSKGVCRRFEGTSSHNKIGKEMEKIICQMLKGLEGPAKGLGGEEEPGAASTEPTRSTFSYDTVFVTKSVSLLERKLSKIMESNGDSIPNYDPEIARSGQSDEKRTGPVDGVSRTQGFVSKNRTDSEMETPTEETFFEITEGPTDFKNRHERPDFLAGDEFPSGDDRKSLTKDRNKPILSQELHEAVEGDGGESTTPTGIDRDSSKTEDKISRTGKREKGEVADADCDGQQQTHPVSIDKYPPQSSPVLEGDNSKTIKNQKREMDLIRNVMSQDYDYDSELIRRLRQNPAGRLPFNLRAGYADHEPFVAEQGASASEPTKFDLGPKNKRGAVWRTGEEEGVDYRHEPNYTEVDRVPEEEKADYEGEEAGAAGVRQEAEAQESELERLATPLQSPPPASNLTAPASTNNTVTECETTVGPPKTPDITGRGEEDGESRGTELEEVLNGKLAKKIVEAILKKVEAVDKLQKELGLEASGSGLLKPSSPPAKGTTLKDAVKAPAATKCHSLTPELKKFLEWLVVEIPGVGGGGEECGEAADEKKYRELLEEGGEESYEYPSYPDEETYEYLEEEEEEEDDQEDRHGKRGEEDWGESVWEPSPQYRRLREEASRHSRTPTFP